MNVRKSEGLGQELPAAGFDHGFLQNFSVEIDDGPVRLDGPALNASDILLAFYKFNFNVALPGSFLGEDLDSHVFAVGGFLGVDVVFAIEDHGRGSGIGGIVFHGQIGGRDGQPVIAGGDRARAGQKRGAQRAEYNGEANESLGSIHAQSPLLFQEKGLPRGAASEPLTRGPVLNR